MAFSTLVKNAINWALAPANLRLDTLTAQRAEETRIRSLRANGYFDSAAFPVPKQFRTANGSAIFAALPQFKTRFDTFRDPSTNDVGYSFENGYFHSPDAEVLYTLIRTRNPKHIVEIGSGHSTKIARQAILDGKLDCHLTSIDPEPRTEISSLADECMCGRVEEVERAIFERLEDGDMLFIDSSHELRIGNDCVFLYSNIIPRLARGVLVQIHDISLPYEYPLQTLADAADWNEQYLVQAMLMFGDAFEVIWPGYFLQRTDKDFMSMFPHNRGERAQSLWLQTRAAAPLK
jgi:predicted O-methyltransferase YrrM